MTRRFYNPSNKDLARKLRSNMTKEERHLWYDFLRTYPQGFVRQRAIGKYVLDFYCGTAKLAIEVDDSQHYETEEEKYDKERDKFLSDQGIRVLRYSNLDINCNFEAVCNDIIKNLQTT